MQLMQMMSVITQIIFWWTLGTRGFKKKTFVYEHVMIRKEH